MPLQEIGRETCGILRQLPSNQGRLLPFLPVRSPGGLVMKTRILVAASVLCFCALIVVGQSKKQPSPSPSPTPNTWSTYEGVTWQKGPSVGQLGINAEVKIPEGYIFAGARDTRTIM